MIGEPVKRTSEFKKPDQYGDTLCKEKVSCRSCEIRYCCRGKFRSPDSNLFEILERVVEKEKTEDFKDVAIYKKMKNRLLDVKKNIQKRS